MDSPEHRQMYFDRAGNPLTLMEWAELIETGEHKRVAYDELPYGDSHIRVSTVWLGLDHNFFTMPGLPHIPLIFETMVFGAPWDEYEEQHRYATEEEALIGHAGVVEMVSMKIMMEARP